MQTDTPHHRDDPQAAKHAKEREAFALLMWAFDGEDLHGGAKRHPDLSRQPPGPDGLPRHSGYIGALHAFVGAGYLETYTDEPYPGATVDRWRATEKGRAFIREWGPPLTLATEED